LRPSHVVEYFRCWDVSLPNEPGQSSSLEQRLLRAELQLEHVSAFVESERGNSNRELGIIYEDIKDLRNRLHMAEVAREATDARIRNMEEKLDSLIGGLRKVVWAVFTGVIGIVIQGAMTVILLAQKGSP